MKEYMYINAGQLNLWHTVKKRSAVQLIYPHRINLYHQDLILHMQGQVLQCVHLHLTLWTMWVAYLSYVTSV